VHVYEYRFAVYLYGSRVGLELGYSRILACPPPGAPVFLSGYRLNDTIRVSLARRSP
jgi:hypothetical protein